MRLTTILLTIAAILVVLIGFTGVADAPMQDEGRNETPPQDNETTVDGPTGPPPAPGELERLNGSDGTG
jgi:hypothetical protein